MRGDQIHDEHSVVRHVPYGQLTEDGKPDVGAFLLRPGEEGLSVNDLSMAEGNDFDAKIRHTKKLMSQRRALGANSKLAVLPVARIHAIEIELPYRVEHRPEEYPAVPRGKENIPHCEILNAITEEQMKVGRTTDVMQLVECVVDLRRVGDLV